MFYLDYEVEGGAVLDDRQEAGETVAVLWS
jgi:hypothetical protein